MMLDRLDAAMVRKIVETNLLGALNVTGVRRFAMAVSAARRAAGAVRQRRRL